ncbi:hypothetical protein CBOM_08088 [Ceraceosorus bombacis]|uniref:Uncharacterized protein n=1 Tax=Ceraceosorus bombacis TaxID=401625 RepID=A0A0P1BS93_9BASI|nr:hypothetical protein CBOM_08088 [Ceraceosorus bombacis]
MTLRAPHRHACPPPSLSTLYVRVCTWPETQCMPRGACFTRLARESHVEPAQDTKKKSSLNPSLFGQRKLLPLLAISDYSFTNPPPTFSLSPPPQKKKNENLF